MTDIDYAIVEKNRKKIIEDKLNAAGPDYNNCLVNLANSILKRFMRN